MNQYSTSMHIFSFCGFNGAFYMSKWQLLSCPTLCDPMNYTVHGILQVRILEWVAFSFSRGSSQPRYQTQVSCIAYRFFTSWATREAHILNDYILLSSYQINYTLKYFTIIMFLIHLTNLTPPSNNSIMHYEQCTQFITDYTQFISLLHYNTAESHFICSFAIII